MVLFTVLCCSSWAAGLIIVEDTHWWPGPIPPAPWPPRPFPPPHPPRPMPPEPVPPPHVFAPLQVTYVKVDTHISDQLATTTIDQEFSNPYGARLEGTFVFPIPKDAQIDKFTMDIDGKPAQAELLAADKARRIYEDIVRKLRDPALLEYAGRDIFKVRIFPIEPHSRKRVTISYTQLLKADDGLVSYLLPLSADKFSAQPVKNVSVKVDLETRRPLKSVYSPSHKVEVKRNGSTRATAGFESSEVQSDEDFALYFAPEKDEIGLNLLTHRIAGEDGYFLLLASPGVDADPKRVIPKDVAFVLDTSGSMAGKKLEQAKKALQFCVENLNEGDRFEIIRFSTEVEPLFDKLVEATKANRSRAEDFIKDLKPMGGTAIDDALQKALSLSPAGVAGNGRVFVVVFLTDGRPTIGTTDEDQILANAKKRNDSRNRVFCFGIGTDVNTHLLDQLTEQARGFSQYVLPEEDLEVKVSGFFTRIKEPVLANPTLKFTGDIRVTKTYPSSLPDLFKGEQLVLVGRYSGKGDSAILLEGAVDGRIKKFTYESKLPEESTESSFIPRLWATRRVGYLLDEIRLHGENAELRDEVTELARKYGIVTPYTAYLIVEDEARRNVPEASQSLQNFGKDREVRSEAARNWSEFKNERAGDGAVSDARYGLALRSADAVTPAAQAGAAAFQRRYGLSPSSGTALGAPVELSGTAARLAQYSQQAQFVSGKNFFQNDRQWVDSAVQKNAQAKQVRIQFASKEYFELAANYPATQKWLALGQNVQFFYNQTVYDIYE
jgi:Ca-activated chloride channel homolog